MHKEFTDVQAGLQAIQTSSECCKQPSFIKNCSGGAVAVNL